MSGIRTPTHVSFYDSAYIILFDDGSWSGEGLCKTLVKKINQNKSNIEFVSLGPDDQWFFRSSNGKVFYSVEDKCLRDDLKTSTGYRPYKLWFNNDNGYILQYDDLDLTWDQIAQDLYNKLNGRQKSLPKVKDITFGMNDTWWVLFQDNIAGWSPDILPDLKTHLRKTEFLALDPIDDNNYFLIKDDEHLHWRVNETFDNDINQIVYINPQDIRYTQSSISSILFHGYTHVDDIPAIKVIQTRSGNYWSLNNRRLWCFRHARNIDRIPVHIVDTRPPWFDKRIQHLQDPFHIHIRGDSESEDGYNSDY